jgi:hypothetical protein
MYEDEAWGRPRDAERFPPPRGNGFYTQEIYYRLLDCGFRIPPSAGSASGVLPNPVGYNRVYVHLEGAFEYQGWWKRLAAGRCFVTNGPMLLVEANGRPPGEVFAAKDGGAVTVELDIRVGGNDPLEVVEVIRDGEVAEALRTGALARERGLHWLRPRPLVFTRSGWFLVRAIADVPGTFRFASSAPFYVEVGDVARRVHTPSVEYFLRWIDERIEALEKSPDLSDEEERASVLRPHRAARTAFERLLAESKGRAQK